MTLLQGGTYTKKTLPCPLCHNTHGCRISANKIFFACLRTSSNQIPHGFKFVKELSNGMGNLFRRDDTYTRAKHTSYLIDNIRRSSRRTPSSSADTRDRSYRKAYSEMCPTLHPHHLKILIDRGLTESFIYDHHFFSYESGRSVVTESVPGIHRTMLSGGSGIFLPAYDFKGRICGAQLYPDKRSDDRKYIWVSSTNVGGEGPSLNGELPLFVWASKENTDTLYLCEGALKSAIAACLSGKTFVGSAASALFGLQQLRTIVIESSTKIVVFCPDGGAIMNGIKLEDGREVYKGGSVASNTFATLNFLERLGIEVKIAWWDQRRKYEDFDIDELLIEGGTMDDVTLISPQMFYDFHHPLLKERLSNFAFQ